HYAVVQTDRGRTGRGTVDIHAASGGGAARAENFAEERVLAARTSLAALGAVVLQDHVGQAGRTTKHIDAASLCAATCRASGSGIAPDGLIVLDGAVVQRQRAPDGVDTAAIPLGA